MLLSRKKLFVKPDYEISVNQMYSIFFCLYLIWFHEIFFPLILFWQKLRESNVFAKELIWRIIFPVRVNFCNAYLFSWNFYDFFLYFQSSRQIQNHRNMLRRNSRPFPLQGPLRIPTNLLKIKMNLLFFVCLKESKMAIFKLTSLK